MERTVYIVEQKAPGREWTPLTEHFHKSEADAFAFKLWEHGEAIRKMGFRHDTEYRVTTGAAVITTPAADAKERA